MPAVRLAEEHTKRERPLSAVATVRQRFGEVAERVVSGDASSLRDLGRLVGAAAADARADDVAWLRLGLSQLAAYELGEGARADIDSLDAVLEGTQAQLDASRSRGMRDEHRQTVKQRLIDALTLHGSMRPKELVDACGSDAYQVSRALRELKDAELVEAGPSSHRLDGVDRRGVWYRLTTRPPAEHFDAGAGPGRQFVLRFLVGSFARGVRVRPQLHDVDIWTHATDGVPIELEPTVQRLTSAWLSLLLEEGLPSGAPPSNLDAVADRFEDAETFASSHDLARLLGAPSEAPIWLAREGQRCWVLTRTSATDASLVDVMTELSNLGDSLVGSLVSSDPSRAKSLADIWHRRAERPAISQIEVATRLPRATLAEFSEEGDASEFWEFEDAFDSSELVAAARMVAGMETEVIRSLVETVRRVPKSETSELNSLTTDAVTFLESERQMRPYEQGYALAAWLRKAIGASRSDVRVDPDTILDVWNVQIVTTASTPDIDGFACWGPRHGPMVAVNEKGRHSESDAGRRATLAHEMAHLLVDRRGALPLAEVLGGRTAPISEARARAFAAEFLLPRDEAGRRLSTTDDPEGEVSDIARHFGVSREIVAWQARNSAHELPWPVYEYLRSLVPPGRVF